MNKNKSEKLYNEKENVRIPQYKKFWYSITKFERYPEMAAEGVGRAISYLAWLIFIFAVILAVSLLIRFHILAKNGIQFLDENISEINYKDGILSVDASNISAATDIGNVIINTEELTDEQINQYENKSSVSNIQIIWLRQKVLAKYGGETLDFYYKDILDEFEINEFDKASLVSYLSNEINSPRIYAVYGIAMIIYLFISYFISALIDILVLSVFGLLTTMIAKIQMRYRAIFNMSVHAITISTVLQLIYTLIKIFTSFNIKYFDLMYTTISFICLAAAIFMIKSDVIKQQLELMKVIEIKRQEQKQEKEDKKEDEKEDNTEERDKKDDEKEKNKDGKVEPDIEGQGSNA